MVAMPGRPGSRPWPSPGDSKPEMPKYLLVPVGGPLEELEVPEGKSYDTLSTAIGGIIECISLDAHLDLWVHEEGKIEQLPHNPRAQYIWNLVFGAGTDYIVGPMVLTGGVDDEGETLGLDAATMLGLKQMFEGVAS